MRLQCSGDSLSAWLWFKGEPRPAAPQALMKIPRTHRLTEGVPGFFLSKGGKAAIRYFEAEQLNDSLAQ